MIEFLDYLADTGFLLQRVGFAWEKELFLTHV